MMSDDDYDRFAHGNGDCLSVDMHARYYDRTSFPLETPTTGFGPIAALVQCPLARLVLKNALPSSAENLQPFMRGRLTFDAEGRAAGIADPAIGIWDSGNGLLHCSTYRRWS
jgi:hypothetical protein